MISKIHNDEQRQVYMARLKRMVEAIEAYDKAKEILQVDTEVKGSLDTRPGYPPNPNLPRGQDFFNHIDNNPDNLTPSESGMSKGRCPV